MPEPTDKCETCGNSWGWHQEEKPVHPFNNGDAGATAFLGKRGDRTHQRDRNEPQQPSQDPPRVVWPTDPVLRIALINKGVLTADDLRAAEEGLRAAMGDVLSKGAESWSATEEGSTASSTRIGNPSTGL
jgi:hypothetical protein